MPDIAENVWVCFFGDGSARVYTEPTTPGDFDHEDVAVVQYGSPLVVENTVGEEGE